MPTRPRRRGGACLRSGASVVVAVVLVLAGTGPALAVPDGGGHGYAPPVDAPLVDPFRPPPHAYGPGNRGVDYDTAAGAPVRSAAAGEVVFSGRVGPSHHVVVLHPDGVRTSYSFLAHVGVRRGDRVEAGQELGRTAGRLHFGARVGDAYVDPLVLFTLGPPQVHLVPDGERLPKSEAEERRGLLESLVAGGARLLVGAVGASADAAGWLFATVVDAQEDLAAFGVELARAWVDGRVQQAVLLAHYVSSAVSLPFTLGAAAATWWHRDGECTPEGVAPPPAGGRRIAVLVAGLGSEGSAEDAIRDVDTGALGYAAADTVQFSYAGGVVPGFGSLEGPAQAGYDRHHTQGDLREAAHRLRQVLADIAARHPGVPVDVIAHSQGGLVARAALAYELDQGSPALPSVGHLVTLGTPHHGADLATAVQLQRSAPPGDLPLEVVQPLVGLDDDAEAVEQLAETSSFIRDLNRRPLPEGVQVTSIATATDAVVTAGRTRIDGATNVLVGPLGGNAHDELPGSPEALREVGLALGGLGPTCRSLLSALAGAGAAELIAAVEDAGAVAAYLGTGAAVDAVEPAVVTAVRQRLRLPWTPRPSHVPIPHEEQEHR